LRWNDFESNISSAFRDLREDKDFFDVTLACVDDQIQAHKVILSACSPFFRGILRRNKHEHPLLYLNGVKYGDLVSVLNFMYHGEVNVAQEELNSFLAVAEDLKVKGLTQNNVDKNVSQPFPQKVKPREPPERVEPNIPPKRPRPQHPPPKLHNSYHQSDDDIQEVIPVKSEPLSLPPEQLASSSNQLADYSEHPSEQDDTMAVADPNMDNSDLYSTEAYEEYQNYEDSGGSGTIDGNKDSDVELDMLIATMISQTRDQNGAIVWCCLQCDKVKKAKGHIADHVEAAHIENTFRPCQYCGKNFKTRNCLRVHISTNHRDMKTSSGFYK